MARKRKVLDNQDLEKNQETGAIINNNKSGFIQRKIVKKANKQKDQTIKDLTARLEALEKLTIK